MKKIERFVVWEPSDEAKHCNHQAVISQKKCMVKITDLDRLEAENQEMLEALIDAVQRFYDYEMSVDTDAPYEHRRAMKFYLKVIEKATGKTWEQIKAGKR